MRTLFLMLFASVSLLHGNSSDSVEDSLRQSYELPLRWDNIEGRPGWISGKEPELNFWRRLHEVELAPGEHTCVRISGDELLRVYRAGGALSSGDVEIALSTGSGLLAFTEPVPDEEQYSLLVDPGRPYAMLAHIFRPAHHQTAIRLGLFTSRHVPLREVAGYRDLVHLPGDPVRLTTSVEADALKFWKWEAGEQAEMHVEAGARYLVETRYRYPPNESKLPQTHHLKVRDDDTGECIASLEYATSHETAHLVFADGVIQVVSRAEPSFFEVPAGNPRRLVIQTHGPVFVRMLRLEDPEYAIPTLNAPRLSPYEASEKLRPGRFQYNPWSMPESRMHTIMRNPLRYPSELVERAAMRLQRDNSRTEGGMTSTHLLLNAGAPRRDYPTIRQRWREFVGYRTYYRDALPEGLCVAGIRRAYFPARRLQETGKYREWLVVADSLIEASHRRLPLATFSPLQGRSNRTTFRLPSKSTYSIIRVATMRDRPVPADFFLQVDDEKPRRFRMVAMPDMPWSETKPSQAEAALTLIEGGTLDAPCSFRRDPEELAPAGYFEFLVPPRSRKIRVWNANDAYHVYVGIQYRTSDVFELSEDEYIHYVNTLGGQAKVFETFTQFLRDAARKEKPTAAEDPEKRASFARAQLELYNHWEPLRRFLISRYRQFVDSVAGPQPPFLNDDWLPKTHALIDQGEYFLAERLARHRYLYNDDPQTREEAYRCLERIAKRHLDPEKQILNACVRAVVEPSPYHLTSLGSLLRHQGEKELALMVAIALPESDAATQELRLACTYRKLWWTHFERYLYQLPEHSDSHIWKARRLWFLGLRAQATVSLRKAGIRGHEWLDHIERTLQARRSVLGGNPDGLKQWAQTDHHHPGHQLWKPVSPQHVESFRAGVTLRALEREKYFHAFIATPKEALELSFAAPGKIRLECRPLHAAGSDEPLEGWVTVEGAGSPRRVPIITNYRSPGLDIVGHPNKAAGTLVWDEFPIGWNGRLTIRPEGCSMFVRVFREVPEARFGHLPPLGYETAAWLFGRQEGSTYEIRDHYYREKMRAEDTPAPHGSAVLVSHNHEIVPFVIEEPFANPPRAEQRTLIPVMAALAPLPIQLDRPDQREALRAMHERLWRREQTNDRTKERHYLAEASAAFYLTPEYPELKRPYSRIVRRTFWEPLLNAQGMAGIRESEHLGWRPENPALLTRLGLLKPLGSREQLISGTDSTVAFLTNREDNAVTLRLENLTIPFLKPEPITVAVRLNDEAEETFQLTAEEPVMEHVFQLPAGQASLKVSVLDSKPNHFLKVDIDAAKERELYERKTRRQHFVATARVPITARIDGPAWVRVDHQQPDGQVHSSYHHLEEPVANLTLREQEGLEESLYRIHTLRLDPDKPFHPPPYTDRKVATVPAPLALQPLREQPMLAAYDDEFHLGWQEDGTWSAGIGYHSRRPTEEDSFGSRDPERFFQGDITHRYYNKDWRAYFRTTALAREREFGKETFGVEHSTQFRPFDHPLNFTLTGNAFSQDGEWALGGRSSVSLTHEWSPKWSYTPSVSLFFREMSLNDAGAFPEEVDQDIFTPYKTDHRRGLRLRNEVSYRPKRDSRLFLGASISTNEDFDLVQPDSFSYWIGTQQLLGPALLRTRLQGFRFFEDNDRSTAAFRHRLHLEATTNHWIVRQHRLEAGISYTHFLEENERAFKIFFNWHLGEGRLWKDFRPGKRPFYELRRRRIPHKRNNRLSLFYPQSGGPSHGEGEK